MCVGQIVQVFERFCILIEVFESFFQYKEDCIILEYFDVLVCFLYYVYIDYGYFVVF